MAYFNYNRRKSSVAQIGDTPMGGENPIRIQSMANVSTMDTEAAVYDMCMAGFILSNTLSENGGVTRGVCSVDDGGCLTAVTETYDIYRDADCMHAKDGSGNILQSVFNKPFLHSEKL